MLEALAPSAEGGRALVDALRLRDSTAAERLLDTYGRRAARLATRVAGNAQDAEEAVQDASWTVIRSIDSFRSEGSRVRLLALPHRRERCVSNTAAPEA